MMAVANELFVKSIMSHKHLFKGDNNEQGESLNQVTKRCSVAGSFAIVISSNKLQHYLIMSTTYSLAVLNLSYIKNFFHFKSFLNRISI